MIDTEVRCLFPSAVALYKFSDLTQAKVAYSRRIRRPGTQELNPFPTFFDVQNVFIGNPKLNPEYTTRSSSGSPVRASLARCSCRRSTVARLTSSALQSTRPTLSTVAKSLQ
ncbi:MAG: outer membrane beta-barrel protein [Gemmatimonadaceae bacterium]